MQASLMVVLLVAGAGAGSASSLTTVAGTGQPGYSGDGGPATRACLNGPFHCDFDRQGNLYIADALNHCVRKVDAKTGMITTVAGCGREGYSGDGGPATQATMNEPYALAVSEHGDLYIVDRLNAVIRRVDGRTGRISTVAGSGNKGVLGDGGPAKSARLQEPNDCVLDGKDGLLVADVSDWRVRRVDLRSGIITTFAGIGRRRLAARTAIGDGGSAAAATLAGPRAVCIDGQGNTFICEREGNAVRKVNAAGTITTIAGTGVRGYTGDGGEARRATFNEPKGIRCDHQGNIYLVDAENSAIRRIDARTNIVTTVAGGHRGADGDGGPPTRAGLAQPHGCTIGPDAAAYIADTLNHRVRKFMPPDGFDGLALIFEDDFAHGAGHWQPTDPKAWKVVKTEHGPAYSLFQQSDYKPPYRSPFNFSLVKDLYVGDFVLDAQVKSTTKDYPHRDMCVIFGYQNASRFYYVHLGKRTDEHANQIFIVREAPRQKISTKTTPGTNWDDGWHHLRIRRTVSDGKIEVYFDNMQEPVMTAADRTFVWGQIGLGSFDDTGDWTDVKLHGNQAARR
jgi:streptogramin lyase